RRQASSASANAQGTSIVESRSSMINIAPAAPGGLQAFAFAAAPSPGDGLAGAYGSIELGGGYSVSAGTPTESVTSRFDYTLDLSKTSATDHLMLNLVNPHETGGGFDTLSLRVQFGLIQVVDKSFSNYAQFSKFVANGPLDLGAASSTGLTVSITSV